MPEAGYRLNYFTTSIAANLPWFEIRTFERDNNGCTVYNTVLALARAWLCRVYISRPVINVAVNGIVDSDEFDL